MALLDTLSTQLGLGPTGANSGDSGSMTPESIELKRKLAIAMLQQGTDSSPIASPWQGLNRVAQSLLGAYNLKTLDKEDKAGKKAADDLLISAFTGGGTVSNPPAIIRPVNGETSLPTMGRPSPSSPAGGAMAAAGRPDDSADIYAPIRQFEGFAPKAKWDYKQNSGGYGSKAEPGEVFTPEKAEARMRQEADPIAARIRQLNPNVTPSQVAALTSFGYNLGAGDIEKLAPDIQAGNWNSVASKMQQYVKAGGEVLPALVDRRKQEAALLLGGGGNDQLGASRPMQTAQATPNTATDATPFSTPQSGAGALQRRAIMLMGNPRTADIGRQLLIKAATAEAPKAPEDVQKYEYATRQDIAAGRQPKLFSDWEIEQKQAGRSQTNVTVAGDQSFEKEFNKLNAERLDKQRGAAENAPNIITANHEARQALDDNGGAFTGAGANIKLGAARWAASLGLIEPSSDTAKMIANTETLIAQRGEAVLASIKALGANPSNSDRIFLEKVKGANIDLNESTLRRLLDIEENVARKGIEKFNVDLKKQAPSFAERLSVEMPEPYKRREGQSMQNGAPAVPAPAPVAPGAPRMPVNGPVTIRTDAEYNALPSGAEFIGPDNKPRRKP